MFHIFLHFFVPLLVARFGFKADWQRAYLVMIATMLVDLDHLLADPVYDPMRCSIGYHPLHTMVPILIYLAMTFHPKTRWVGLGLTIHMALDSLDCYVNLGIWFT